MRIDPRILDTKILEFLLCDTSTTATATTTASTVSTTTVAASTTTKEKIPKWTVTADWFDVCKCSIQCLCIFAHAPTYGDCDEVLAYHIKKGIYVKTQLD